MKTITEIKKHFSVGEIKILIEIVKGQQDYDVMKNQIENFYDDEIPIWEDNIHDDLRGYLLEKLEVDLEMGGVI
jgi:hypothetical protein